MNVINPLSCFKRKTNEHDITVLSLIPTLSAFEPADLFSQNLIWALCHYKTPKKLFSFLQLDIKTSQVGATEALLLGSEMLYGNRVWKNVQVLFR
jgi:hypothetical protein